MIRYLMLSFLKLNMTVMLTLRATNHENSWQVPVAIASLALLSLMPIFFSFVLYKKHTELDLEENHKKIGTLYLGHNVGGDRLIRPEFFPCAFFYRRTIFLTVSIFLFEKPAMQLMVHGVLTLLTIIYLSVDTRMFKQRTQAFVEIGSEVILLEITVVLS